MVTETKFLNNNIEYLIFGDKFLIYHSQKMNSVVIRKNNVIIGIFEDFKEAKEEFERYKIKHYGKI